MASEIGRFFHCVVTFIFYFYKAVVATKSHIAETADTPQQESCSQQATSGAKRKLIFSSPSKDKVSSKIKSCSNRIFWNQLFLIPVQLLVTCSLVGKACVLVVCPCWRHDSGSCVCPCRRPDSGSCRQGVCSHCVSLSAT